MNVSLTPELEQLINGKVKSGLYQTASEVVREALRLLKRNDDRAARLRADIRAGFAQVERGEFFEYDETTTGDLTEKIKAGARKRLAQKRKTAR